MKKLTLAVVIFVTTILLCSGCSNRESYTSMDKEKISLSYGYSSEGRKDVMSVEIPKNVEINAYSFDSTKQEKITLEQLKSIAASNGYGPEYINFTLYDGDEEILVSLSTMPTSSSGDSKYEKTETINGKKLSYGEGEYLKDLNAYYELSDTYSLRISISNASLKNIGSSALTPENIKLLKEIVEIVTLN